TLAASAYYLTQVLHSRLGSACSQTQEVHGVILERAIPLLHQEDADSRDIHKGGKRKNKTLKRKTGKINEGKKK
ncbi:MAG: hypothetical protein ACRC4X_00420, partial [Cetobacterium sp.]